LREFSFKLLVQDAKFGFRHLGSPQQQQW